MHFTTFIKGIAIGAGFMYLFDPDRGRSRRALIRDKAVHYWNEAGDAVESKTRDLSNRAQGLIHDAATALSPSGKNATTNFQGSKAAWMPANWSPTTRLLVTAGAGLLAFYGKRRGDMLGTALGALSIGVITNSINRSELRHGIAASPSLPSDYESDPDSGFTALNRAAEHKPRAARTH